MPEIMESYKDFVRKNRDFVQSLESIANGLTWVLPERFSNSEIVPEAVYAILSIIASVNQHIIDTTPKFSSQFASTVKSFPWPLCVSILKDLEAVVEVAAEHFHGETGKWDFIVVTEVTKVLIRLAFLRDSGYKMLLRGGELINENDGGKNASENQHDCGMNISGMPYGYGGIQRHRNPRSAVENRALVAMCRFGETARMDSDPLWLDRRFPQIRVQPVQKPSISSIWSEKGLVGGLFVTGEILYIMRPLIYIIFIKKIGIKSWKPWLLSLAVDISSMGFLRYATQTRQGNKNNFVTISESEKDELKRRKLICALYIMRDPFFSTYTRQHLEKTDKYLCQVPLIGFLAGKLLDLIVGAQGRYTYMSGS